MTFFTTSERPMLRQIKNFAIGRMLNTRELQLEAASAAFFVLASFSPVSLMVHFPFCVLAWCRLFAALEEGSFSIFPLETILVLVRLEKNNFWSLYLDLSGPPPETGQYFWVFLIFRDRRPESHKN